MVGGRQLGTRLLRLYLPLAVCVILMLFPFYWMVITSIKPNRELYSQKIMPLIVHQPTLKHYVDLLTETNFLTWTYNTMAEGPTVGIAAIERIEQDSALARYYLLPAALGRLWLEAGDPERAARYFEEALIRPCSAPERRFLERQLTQCRPRAPR